MNVKPEACRYAQSHEWVSLDGASAVVGISDHAQKEITDVVFVDLPKPGRKVTKGEAVAVVESVKAAFDIYAPVSGEIEAANAALAGNPALVNQAPHGDGWLFKIKPSDPKEADALMSFSDYEKFLKSAAH
ncbi:MAG TPA: glycine cleavage system protein GcvH [Elusimicrobiota bacterium]|nr:glycine cleavage system protein GcvH [Elusimicrobiota bacterium]